MISDQDYSERREHERVELKKRIFITIRPEFDRIGWLKDISRGGISFEYAMIQDYTPLTEKVHVDIFSSPRELDLFNLPCRLVYDTPSNDGEGLMTSIGTRRCGLVFNGLSQEHAVQIDAAINGTHINK